LHIFKVDGPALTQLIPHRFNPVVFDAATARNAGRVLTIDGALCRPSQDNSRGIYGHSLNLMRIEHLSLDDYAETRVWRLEPDEASGYTGCHHIDIRSGRIVIDARRALGGRPARQAAAQ
jgi:hypothetical protein